VAGGLHARASDASCGAARGWVIGSEKTAMAVSGVGGRKNREPDRQEERRLLEVALRGRQRSSKGVEKDRWWGGEREPKLQRIVLLARQIRCY